MGFVLFQHVYTISYPVCDSCNITCYDLLKLYIYFYCFHLPLTRLQPELSRVLSIVCHILWTLLSVCDYVYIQIHQGLEKNSFLSDLIWQLLPSVITAVNLSHLSGELKSWYLSMRVWITIGMQINTSYSAMQAVTPWSAKFTFQQENCILAAPYSTYFIFLCYVLHSFFVNVALFTVGHWTVRD